MGLNVLIATASAQCPAPAAPQPVPVVVFDDQHTSQEIQLYSGELILVQFPPPASVFWLEKVRSGTEPETLRDDALLAALQGISRDASSNTPPLAFRVKDAGDVRIDFKPFSPPTITPLPSLPESLSLTMHVAVGPRPSVNSTRAESAHPAPAAPTGFWARLFGRREKSAPPSVPVCTTP